MGWTFMPSHGRGRFEIIAKQLDYENDAYTQKVIDQALDGATVYLLAERRPKGEWRPDSTYINDADGSFRWIGVFLTRKARDACDFGYKDMSESMGPRERRCPKRLIAHASPLRNPDLDHNGNYAAQWRRDCLNHRAKQSERRRTKLVAGTVIRLSRPLEFTDGYKGDLFTIEIVERRGRKQTCFNAPNGRLYRIGNLHAIGYQVEAAHA
jgi:hypothetical protein